MSENEPNQEALRLENTKLVNGLMAYLEEFYLPKLDQHADDQYVKIIDSLPGEKWVNQLSLEEILDLSGRLHEFAQTIGVDPSEITAERLQQYSQLADSRIHDILNRLSNDTNEIPMGDEDEKKH